MNIKKAKIIGLAAFSIGLSADASDSQENLTDLNEVCSNQTTVKSNDSPSESRIDKNFWTGDRQKYKNRNEDFLSRVPKGVIGLILSHLKGKDYKNFALLNKRFNMLALEPSNFNKSNLWLRFRDLGDLNLHLSRIKNSSSVRNMSFRGFMCKAKDYEHFKHLKDFEGYCIDLSHNYSLTNQDLEYFSGAKYVNLRECDQITDAGLKHLKNATYLNLKRCNVTIEAVEKLREKGVKVIY